MAHIIVIGARPHCEFAPSNPWIAFEKYFLRKVRTGSLTPVYETYVLKLIGIVSLKKRTQ
jgi:hypothetical protein